jgi:hypothetical protein
MRLPIVEAFVGRYSRIEAFAAAFVLQVEENLYFELNS